MNLTQLEAYFSSVKLPQTLQLSEGEFITDLRLFVDNHISILYNNSGKPTFVPYYLRLIKIYNLINI